MYLSVYKIDKSPTLTSSAATQCVLKLLKPLSDVIRGTNTSMSRNLSKCPFKYMESPTKHQFELQFWGRLQIDD